MRFDKKDILDIQSLSREEITLILDTAQGMKEISQRPVKKVPTLRGKTIVFFSRNPPQGPSFPLSWRPNASPPIPYP